MNVTNNKGKAIIVQKFGGIAMQNKQHRLFCIAHIQNALLEGKKIVVVVSAMGRQGEPYATDSLLTITNAFQYKSAASDLVASCGELIAASVLSAELSEHEVSNKILYGNEAGIMTTGPFGNAAIEEIKSESLLRHFKHTSCLIIPGFQGINKHGELMTLGRGGSDLTAVALAAALHATHVEFYKDVEAVMTTNPKYSSKYEPILSMTYDELIQLLQTPSPILQQKAAQLAKEKAIPLHIRGIASNTPGTWIQ